MDKQRGLIFKTGLILLLLLQVITCMKINRVRVPASYNISRDENESKPLILGCDYEIDESESKGFVLKWKHNDLQFYQWIPSRNPIVFSSFKGQIDVEYSESEERLHKHSALKFINPMANYTGNYTCQISTFDDLASGTAHLQMIVPETDFTLGLQRETNGSTVVFCNVGEIYPLPDVSLRIDNEKVSDAVVFEQVQEYTGYYNVSVQYILPDQNKNMELQCDFTIPSTDYTRRTVTSYHGAGYRANAAVVQVFVGFILSTTVATLLTKF
ncbi:uncharacterized protein LOC126567468 [Anopheles maculipalpis]|uniref:uncharacterized protein LOC126567468 n=1 Tax=Anopheles maculipalpis TaxID=1496333 RepID=UPI002158F534|nr:uncharacterized protein LOC126567468 [Anopheles maculipalpis]